MRDATLRTCRMDLATTAILRTMAVELHAWIGLLVKPGYCKTCHRKMHRDGGEWCTRPIFSVLQAELARDMIPHTSHSRPPNFVSVDKDE